MDWTVYPDSPIARLPRMLRPAALLARNAVARLPPSLSGPVNELVERSGRQWTYDADGMATVHYSPFQDDREFTRLYDEMSEEWFVGTLMEARWRMWLLTRHAAYASRLPGNFAEFGVYRAGCARMVLGTTALDPGRRLYLFDTYSGIPDDRLTPGERQEGLGGSLADTSAEYVRRLLSPWDPIPVVCAGDVFETIPATDTGPLAFVHLDLNAAAPTRHVLEHVYDRIVPGGVVVFDDYGWSGYEDQRRTIDEFLRDQTETIIALPTGQATFLKTGGT
jgi:O-methyltransferase